MSGQTLDQVRDENFENRAKYSEEEARRILVEEAGAAVMHLLDNGDGTFSIMSHIVCEMCDYCIEQGDCRGNEKAFAVPAKSDPYASAKEE